MPLQNDKTGNKWYCDPLNNVLLISYQVLYLKQSSI